MADVACFRAPSCSDGESVRQRSLLAGHLKCEQLTARRRFLTSLLALMSAPVWAMAVWPQLLQGPDRRFLLYLFGFLLVLSFWAVLEEWRAANRLRKSLEEAPSAADRSGPDTLPDCDSPPIHCAANAAAATPHP
jgi:hypothetical protein